MRSDGPRPDPVALAEAAWRTYADDQSWLDGVAESVGQYVEASLGVAAVRCNVSAWKSGSGVEVTGVGHWNFGDATLQAIGVMASRPITHEEHLGFVKGGAVFSIARALGPTFAAPGGFGERFREVGFDDMLMLQAGDPLGVSLGVIIPQRRRASVPRRKAWTLARTTAHLASSDRMRLRSGGDDSLDRDADAIFAPNGRVLDARNELKDGELRSRVRAAALALDRCRGSLRRKDPEGALDLWTALISGKWSLVDRFDSDGRRFVVARRNTPEAEGRLALTDRESAVLRLAALGHSNKLIAYGLGITASSAGTHLANAMAKLGLKTRVEVITLVESLRVPAAAEPRA